MTRTWLGGLLALFLSLGPVTAQSVGFADPECVGGRARGNWDLPAGDLGGRVRGVLVDAQGRRLALLARLTAADVRLATSGRIDGLLYPLLTNGQRMPPVAEVHGSWTVGLDGRGRFEAGITALTLDPKLPPDAIGKIAGAFADPQVIGRNPVGTFVGEWALCR